MRGHLANKLDAPGSCYGIDWHQYRVCQHNGVTEREFTHKELPRRPVIIGNRSVAGFKERVVVPDLVFNCIRRAGHHH